MKRRAFIAFLEKHGCYLLRHGARHDLYVNPANGNKQTVPRHSEIDDQLARHIKKQLAL